MAESSSLPGLSLRSPFPCWLSGLAGGGGGLLSAPRGSLHFQTSNFASSSSQYSDLSDFLFCHQLEKICFQRAPWLDWTHLKNLPFAIRGTNQGVKVIEAVLNWPTAVPASSLFWNFSIIFFGTIKEERNLLCIWHFPQKQLEGSAPIIWQRLSLVVRIMANLSFCFSIFSKAFARRKC